LCGSEWRIGRAKSQDVDDAAGSISSDALVLVVQEVVMCDIPGNFGKRVWVDCILFQLAQFLGETGEALEELIEGWRLPSAP
jgi:hypothetical protein